MSGAGDNRLPTLAKEVAGLHLEIGQHANAMSEKALQAGAALAEAKELVGHGGWAGWLAEAGINERTARRYIRVWRSGLNRTLVSDLGGVTATLAFLRQWQMPGSGEALHVDVGEGESCNFAFIWCDEDNPDHVVITACIGDQTLRTKRPMRPYIDVPGHQPVDTVAAWLETHELGPASDWQISTCDLRMARAVIDPLVWFAMVDEIESCPAKLAD